MVQVYIYEHTSLPEGLPNGPFRRKNEELCC